MIKNLNINTIYFDTVGYNGPVPIYLSGYRGPYVDSESISCEKSIKIPGLKIKICFICRKTFETGAGQRLTCTKECSLKLRQQRREQDKELFRKQPIENNEIQTESTSEISISESLEYKQEGS